MKILGIDPGTNNLGFAILDVSNRELLVRDHGVFHLPRADTHQEKLHKIFLKIGELIDNHGPAEMAIEAPFYGKNVQSMLKLGRAQGVAIAAALNKSITVQEYSPKKIKLAAKLMKNPEIPIKEICSKLGVSKSTLYRYVSPDGQIRLE